MHKHIVYFYNSRDKLRRQVYTENNWLSTVESQEQSKSAADSYIIAGRRHFLGFMDYIFCTDRSTRPPISRRSCILLNSNNHPN